MRDELIATYVVLDISVIRSLAFTFIIVIRYLLLRSVIYDVNNIVLRRPYDTRARINVSCINGYAEVGRTDEEN